LQTHPDLPQPRWNEVVSRPLLNPVKRKQPVRLSAALLAEDKHGKAVRAPPLEWSRLAALARSNCQNALRVKEAAQVRANLGDKFFNVAVLELGDA
jgi:hypothetical protein